MASAGENLAVQAIAPRAYALSQGLLGPGLLSLRFARFLIILAAIGFTSAGLALASQANSARVRALDASAKLLKVLDANCR
jgi:hypothetical protein